MKCCLTSELKVKVLVLREPVKGFDLLLVIRLLVKSCRCRHSCGGAGALLCIVPLKVAAALSALIKAPNRADSGRGRRETEPGLLIVIVLELEQGLKCTGRDLGFCGLFHQMGRKCVRTHGRRPTENNAMRSLSMSFITCKSESDCVSASPLMAWISSAVDWARILACLTISLVL